MNITEYDIKNIVELLDKGERPKIGDIAISKSDNNVLNVSGWTNYSDIGSIEEKIARQELDEIKTLFLRLQDESPEFKSYCLNKKIILNLCIDMYKAGLLVCALVDGEFKWANLKNKMNNELQFIIRNLQNINTGQPWYGRPVYEMLDEIDPAIVYKKPNKQHSLAELLYHMITWADFTLHRLKGDKEKDMAVFEELDWREIDPKVHTWKKGLSEFKAIHEKIIELLDKKMMRF